MFGVDEFFQALWQDYTKIAPMALKLRNQVLERGEFPANDHIAFRTFDCAPINLLALEKHLLTLGYNRYAPYEFKDKKLKAFGYVHPDGHPRIFLSELMTAEFSPFLQHTVRGLCAQVDPRRVAEPSVLWSGRLWNPVSYKDYLRLSEESEYAGWVAALGLRANHFTISINTLKTFQGIHPFAEWLAAEGYPLNTSGGVIKGTPAVLLEQGSTLADEVEIEFAGGERHRIPTCYYEFAMRYPDASAGGKLYDGFVAASADKIFESTNRR
ncbi:MAG: DUF1338 domain-containing protein [Candidatus Sumerlaeia bacterium]|nr:DUF1338 domain-containing protein [Candidatus Sumerlaeia bacterium]